MLLFGTFESYKILKAPVVFNGRFLNKCIYAPKVEYISLDKPLSYLIYKKYQLFVFNLTYSKVSYGSLLFLKQFSLNFLIKRLFYYITGLSRVFFYTFFYIVKYLSKSMSYEEIISDIFMHYNDNRRLILMEGKWIANNPAHGLLKIFINTLPSGDKKVFGNCCFELTNFGIIKSTMYKHKIGNDIPHVCVSGVGLNTNLMDLQTKRNKAVLENFYGKELIIPNFIGTNGYTSVLIGVPKSELYMYKVGPIVPYYSLVRGALLWGYGNVSENFIHKVYTMKEIDDTILEIFTKHNLAVNHKEMLDNVHKICSMYSPDYFSLKKDFF